MARGAILLAAAIFFGSYFLQSNQTISLEVFQICSWVSTGIAAAVVLWSLFRLFAGGVSRIAVGLLLVAGLLIGGAAIYMTAFSKG